MGQGRASLGCCCLFRSAASNNGAVGLLELTELARVTGLKRNEADFAVSLNRSATSAASKARLRQGCTAEPSGFAEYAERSRPAVHATQGGARGQPVRRSVGSAPAVAETDGLVGSRRVPRMRARVRGACCCAYRPACLCVRALPRV